MYVPIVDGLGVQLNKSNTANQFYFVLKCLIHPISRFAQRLMSGNLIIFS